ncbi:MAG: RtcB family protein, partial [Bacteroidota bacterium]
MAKLKLRKKDLIQLGCPDGRVIGLAINMALRYYKRSPKADVLAMLSKVLQDRAKYLEDAVWKEVAIALQKDTISGEHFQLLTTAKSFPIYGESEIEAGA